jgi:hypothetical protein
MENQPSDDQTAQMNVEPGWTYVFTAMWDSNLIFLRPSGVWLTPGELCGVTPRSNRQG